LWPKAIFCFGKLNCVWAFLCTKHHASGSIPLHNMLFEGPNISPHPTLENPLALMIASIYKVGQFSSCLQLPWVGNLVIKWHTWCRSCMSHEFNACLDILLQIVIWSTFQVWKLTFWIVIGVLWGELSFNVALEFFLGIAMSFPIHSWTIFY